jgi:hypothetical protein
MSDIPVIGEKKCTLCQRVPPNNGPLFQQAPLENGAIPFYCTGCNTIMALGGVHQKLDMLAGAISRLYDQINGVGHPIQ